MPIIWIREELFEKLRTARVGREPFGSVVERMLEAGEQQEAKC